MALKPYYDEDGITIYHGDCREIVPQLGKFDLLLTDPPYGIGADKPRGNTGRNKHILQREYPQTDWDNKPADSDFLNSIILGKMACVWGGNYFSLPPSRAWLVWDKENGENRYADAELAWTNFDTAVRRIKYRWHGYLQEKSGSAKEARFHPTQKPLDVISWCITLAGDSAQTILDPFAGSGTTGRAAKDLGRKCTMIEREEKYCEIAARRMQQQVLITA